MSTFFEQLQLLSINLFEQFCYLFGSIIFSSAHQFDIISQTGLRDTSLIKAIQDCFIHTLIKWTL